MTVNAGEPFLLQFVMANKTDYSVLIDQAQLKLVSFPVIFFEIFTHYYKVYGVL